MRLLCETHVPGALVQQLRLRGIDAIALQEWQGGAYRNADDETILAAAYADQRILVTFDRMTFPSRLKALAEVGDHHAGVILVSDKTLPPTDIGGLLRTLVRVLDIYGDQGWENRVIYLTAADMAPG
jgi:predicted nuclease of predicted toxin-antitoxin system